MPEPAPAQAGVEQFLAPALAPGDVVELDNLAAHKVDGVRQAITAAGASILYLPPYSPDLNPIEQLFAKLKALLRTAATRTVDRLGHALDTVPPAECANYLAHAGYVPSNRGAALTWLAVSKAAPRYPSHFCKLA